MECVRIYVSLRMPQIRRILSTCLRSVLLCACAASMGFTYMHGQTTRSAGRIAATNALPNAVYDNPAVMTVRQDSSLTDFAAGYASSNGSIKPSYVGIGYCNEYMSDGFTTAYQDGTTWAGWAFEANAYMKRDTAMAVWGKASYNPDDMSLHYVTETSAGFQVELILQYENNLLKEIILQTV